MEEKDLDYCSICFDDINQDVTQIILAALLGVVLDRRSDRGWGNRHDLTHHPIWTRPQWAEPHECDILVRDALEIFQYNFRSNLNNNRLCFGIVVLPLGKYSSKALFSNFIWL